MKTATEWNAWIASLKVLGGFSFGYGTFIPLHSIAFIGLAVADGKTQLDPAGGVVIPFMPLGA